MAFTQIGVQITADASRFKAELDKSTQAARKAGDDIGAAFGKVKGILGAIGVGISAAEIISWGKEVISAAAALNDLSESTGSSVEALSRLSNQAKVAGVPFENFQSALNKLAAGMNGVDDESTKIGASLARLGITTKDPAEAFTQLAVKLSQYQDGVGKAAALADIFGKNWAAVVPALRAVTEQQDVQATVTQKQAEAADRLEKEWRKLAESGNALKTVLLSDVVPALSQLATGYMQARQAGLDWAASLQVGFAAAIDVEKSIGNLGIRVQDLTKKVNDAKKYGFTSWLEDWQTELAKTQGQLRVLIGLRDRAIMSNADSLINARPDKNDMLTWAKPKPGLDWTKPPAGGAATAEKISEYERALARFRKMGAETGAEIESAFSMEEVSSAQKALAALVADDAWGKMSAQQQDAVRGAAASVDYLQKHLAGMKAEADERKKQIDDMFRIADLELQEKERAMDSLAGYEERTALMGRELAIAGEGAAAHQRLAAELEKENQIRIAMAANLPGNVPAIEEQYRRQLAFINALEYTNQKLQESAEYSRIFEDALGGALENLISGTQSLSEAFKSMERIIVAGISRIAINNISDAIFGGNRSNGASVGGLGMWAGGLLGGLFGGSSFSPAGVSIAAGAGLNPLDMLGFGGIPGFASGTRSAPGGIALVGERGPELVNLPRGASVTPNHALRRGPSIVQNINVMPGATRASADQAAAAAAYHAQRALARVA